MSAQRRPDHDDVARRAFELFLSRGGGHGHDQEDWLQAERELSQAANTDQPAPEGEQAARDDEPSTTPSPEARQPAKKAAARPARARSAAGKK